ncbi:DUF2304 domain-containing protein [Thomasclavelia cocleata]|uniref:DUF2304 domain-containing protein n=1 Tax=Thomasclavelia cocleata TaxID=69824 RepID=UPI0025A0FD6D|nr:DUF2304 domain-containing protein [Thomasclavelia cocleata]MCX4374682.1 DUF2304 domain-containing protein [Lachnospiraceae bacterium]
MSLFLRIILLVASVLFAIYVIKKIRKSQMKIGDSIYWISLIVLIVTLSIFPNIIISLAKWIGIESPANLLYLLMIFIAIGKIFFLSVQNSQLEYKICILAEEIAIWKNQSENIQNTKTAITTDERKYI